METGGKLMALMRQLSSSVVPIRAKDQLVSKCLYHTGYIEVFMQGKCGRNTETTFDIK